MPRGQTPAVSSPAPAAGSVTAAHDGTPRYRDAPSRPAASGQAMSGV